MQGAQIHRHACIHKIKGRGLQGPLTGAVSRVKTGDCEELPKLQVVQDAKVSDCFSLVGQWL